MPSVRQCSQSGRKRIQSLCSAPCILAWYTSEAGLGGLGIMYRVTDGIYLRKDTSPNGSLRSLVTKIYEQQTTTRTENHSRRVTDTDHDHHAGIDGFYVQ